MDRPLSPRSLNIRYRFCIGRNGGKSYLQKQGGAIGWKSILATWNEDLLSDYNLRYEYGKITFQMPNFEFFAFSRVIFCRKSYNFGENTRKNGNWLQFHEILKQISKSAVFRKMNQCGIIRMKSRFFSILQLFRSSIKLKKTFVTRIELFSIRNKTWSITFSKLRPLKMFIFISKK